jgi:TolB-like protein
MRRRNVLRVGTAYLVAAWLLVQVPGTLFPLFGFDETPARVVVIVLAIGFLPALVLAWVFEFTPEGLKRESEVDRSRSVAPQAGKLLDRIIMIVLAVSLSYFAFDKFVLLPRREAALEQQRSEAVAEARAKGRSEALESNGERSIAVLPFVNMSSDKEQEYFSDGISEELLNLLARIPDLKVIARTSSFAFKGEKVEIAEIARRLNVAHVLEGSVRKAGNTVRKRRSSCVPPTARTCGRKPTIARSRTSSRCRTRSPAPSSRSSRSSCSARCRAPSRSSRGSIRCCCRARH